MFGSSFSVEDAASVTFALEVITAVLSLLFFRKYSDTFLKYLPLLLWYTVGNELVAKWYGLNVEPNNTVFYNVYRILEFTFYLLLYYHIAETARHKKIALYFLFIYYASVLVSLFLQDFRTEYFAYPYFVGSVFVSVCIILYMSEILNSEKVLFVTRTFIFWVSTGAFIYYLISVPFKIMQRYFNNGALPQNLVDDNSDIPYIYMANIAVVFIYYLILSTGLIWSKAAWKY